MKTAFYCFLAFLCPFLPLQSQPAKRSIVHPLTVGEPVPNLLFSHLVQYAAPTARLSDFSNKVVILDLMTSRCGSCVEHLQHWDTLQARYADRLQILPVTYESPAIIKAFLKNAYSKNLRYPFVTNDTLIRKVFPHQFISHMVWIYKGQVQAITKPDYVTPANIETLLQGQPLHLPVKKDVGKYDPSAPLWTANGETILPENASQFRYYSSLIPYMDGFSFGQYEFNDTVRGSHRSTFINWPIDYLYRHALGVSDRFPAAFFRYELKDSSRFFMPQGSYWSEWHHIAYCGYQSSLPLQLPDSLRKQRLLSDLDSYLGLRGRMENRTVRCIVLRPDTSVHQLPPRPPGRIAEIFGLALIHNSRKGATPMLIEMGKDDQRHVPLLPNMEDLPAMQAALQPFGIRVTTEQRELSMLVLTDAVTAVP